MAHFSLWQRSPFRNSFMPSRRHCRQTGPIYLAKLLLLTFLPTSGAVYSHWRGLLPAYFGGRGSGAGASGKVARSPAPSPQPPDPFLHSPLLRRTAAVVRDRGDVLNGPDFDTCR